MWEREIEGIKEAIRNGAHSPILILSDIQAVIKAIVKAGNRGRARTAAMKEIIEGIAKRLGQGEENTHGVALTGVKAHAERSGNEMVDQIVRDALQSPKVNKVREGGIKAV